MRVQEIHSCHCRLLRTRTQPNRSQAQKSLQRAVRTGDPGFCPLDKSRRGHPRKRQCCQISAASSTAAPVTSQQHQSSEHSSPILPQSLRNQVAKVAITRPGSQQQTDVYILGMSHVSQASCDDIEQLIDLVQPDVVFAEVCRERVGLLLPAKQPSRSAQVWQAPTVPLPGLPTEEGWPTPEQVGQLLKSKPLAPVSTYDIEQDCIRLLSTGLFQSVRPKLNRPGRGAGPSFIEAAGGDLVASIPSAAMEYLLVPRKFAKIDAFSARVDSSLGNAQLPEQEVDSLRTSLLQDVGAGVGTVPACSKLRHSVQQLAVRQGLAEQPSHVEVSFLGIETGRVEAVIKRASSGADAPGYTSGFEASAVGSQGPGIQPFRPNRGSVELSTRMFLPNMGDLLGTRDQGLDSMLAESAPSGNGKQRRQAMQTSWRPWTHEERDEARQQAEEEEGSEEEESESWSDKFSNLLTSTYGQLQSAAGKVVGVPQGEAWRAALRGAARCGAAQVHLGDVPATITGERLSRGIFTGSILSVTFAAVLTAVIVTAEMMTDISRFPSYLFPVTETAAWVIALLPILGPLYEIWAFSRQSKEAIEEQVRVKEPLQGSVNKGMYRVKGEDAITSWPKAMQTVIQDRDTYMAAGLKAIALGKPAGPALVHDQDDRGRHRWRYCMPENGPPGASWLGSGEGVYQPLPAPQRIVAVVGTAHVRGMVREWERPHDEACMQAVLDRPQH